jgi:hypothetical protein
LFLHLPISPSLIRQTRLSSFQSWASFSSKKLTARINHHIDPNHCAIWFVASSRLCTFSSIFWKIGGLVWCCEFLSCG